MGAFLESTFFSDKIRGMITMFLLVLIAGFLLFQALFPHTPTLDKATMTSLVEVTETLRKAASNLESAGQSQAELNDTLKQQLGAMSVARSKGYEKLLKEYGLSVDLPTSSGPGYINGVQQSPDNIGRKPVPTGASPASSNPILPIPITKHKNPPDASTTGN